MPGTVGQLPANKFFLALILFLLNTGVRINAAMRTPSAGLDLARGWLKVPAHIQKQLSDQHFDLLPLTVEALALISPSRNTTIFEEWPYDRSEKNRKRGKWPALTKRLKRILVNAGIYASVKDVPPTDLFHKMRRCFASFVAAKSSTQTAQDFLGHSDVKVTKPYLDKRISPARPLLSNLLTEMMPAELPTPDPQKRLFD
jgi:integrase